MPKETAIVMLTGKAGWIPLHPQSDVVEKVYGYTFSTTKGSHQKVKVRGKYHMYKMHLSIAVDSVAELSSWCSVLPEKPLEAMSTC